MTKLYRCNVISTSNHQDTINLCLKKQMNIGKKIGEGTYGVVYIADYDGKKCAIKVMTPKVWSKKEAFDELEDIEKEVEFNYYMASKNLGPKIFSAFYILDETTVVPKITCFLIMEFFENSVGNILNNATLDETTILSAKMLQLLHKQVFECELFCSDLKPDNCVATKKNNDYTVRLIDFGSYFCKKKTFDSRYINKDIFYLIMLIQLMLLTYNSMKKNIPNKEHALSPFIQDPIFRKYYGNGFINNNFKHILLKIYYYDREELSAHRHYAHYYIKSSNISNEEMVDRTIDMVDHIVNIASSAPLVTLTPNIKPTMNSITFSPRHQNNVPNLYIGKTKCKGTNKLKCSNSLDCDWVVGTGCVPKGIKIKPATTIKVCKYLKKKDCSTRADCDWTVGSGCSIRTKRSAKRRVVKSPKRRVVKSPKRRVVKSPKRRVVRRIVRRSVPKSCSKLRKQECINSTTCNWVVGSGCKSN